MIHLCGRFCNILWGDFLVDGSNPLACRRNVGLLSSSTCLTIPFFSVQLVNSILHYVLEEILLCMYHVGTFLLFLFFLVPSRRFTLKQQQNAGGRPLNLWQPVPVSILSAPSFFPTVRNELRLFGRQPGGRHAGRMQIGINCTGIKKTSPEWKEVHSCCVMAEWGWLLSCPFQTHLKLGQIHSGLNDPSRPCCNHTLTRVADGSLNQLHQQKRGRRELVGDGEGICD